MSAIDKAGQKFVNFKNALCATCKGTNSALFYFAINLNCRQEQFKINIDTRCLVLTQYPGAEIKGVGGLIAQYPKNFEVLCFTDGSGDYANSQAQSNSIGRQRFHEVLKELRVKGFKIFDIETNTLKTKYSKFKKIDISEADYIFVPNLYDNREDTIYLLKHFKQLLKEKERKPKLTIVMYEADYPLCSPNYIANISNIIETKKKMLDIYYPNDQFKNLSEKAIALNAFRALNYNCDYCEAFMTFDIEDFEKINLI